MDEAGDQSAYEEGEEDQSAGEKEARKPISSRWAGGATSQCPRCGGKDERGAEVPRSPGMGHPQRPKYSDQLCAYHTAVSFFSF